MKFDLREKFIFISLITILLLLITYGLASTFFLNPTNDANSKEFFIEGEIEMSMQWIDECGYNGSKCKRTLPTQIVLYRYNPEEIRSSEAYITTTIINWNKTRGTFLLSAESSIPRNYILRVGCKVYENIEINPHKKNSYYQSLNLDNECYKLDSEINYDDYSINDLHIKIDGLTNSANIFLDHTYLSKEEKHILNDLVGKAIQHSQESKLTENQTESRLESLKSIGYLYETIKRGNYFKGNYMNNKTKDIILKFEPLYFTPQKQLITQHNRNNNLLEGLFNKREFKTRTLDEYEGVENISEIKREIKYTTKEIQKLKELNELIDDNLELIEEDFENQDKYVLWKKISFFSAIIFVFWIGVCFRKIIDLFGYLFSSEDGIFKKEILNKDTKNEDVKILLSMNAIMGTILAFGLLFLENIKGSVSTFILFISFISFFLMMIGLIFGILYLRNHNSKLANACWFFTFLGLFVFIFYLSFVILSMGLSEFIKFLIEIFTSKKP